MSKLLQSSLLLVAGIAIGLVAFAMIDNMINDESGGEVVVVETPEEDSSKLAMINQTTNFNNEYQQNGIGVFSYSYEMSGEALMAILTDNKANSICILNGLKDSTQMTPSQRVFIIAPMDATNRIVQTGIAYVSEDINYTPFNFFTRPSILTKYAPDRRRLFDQTRNLYSNFQAYLRVHNSQGLTTDTVRAFTIPENQLRFLLSAGADGKPQYNIRARFGLSIDDAGEFVRSITLNSIDMTTGYDLFSLPMVPLTDRRICPNNCDFF